MQAVVKMHRIRIEAESIPEDLIEFLKRTYGEVEIIEDPDEEFVEVTKTDWYKKIRKKITPGENMRFYRDLRDWTQDELGERLGGVSRQNVSGMEKGRREISKKTAKALAKLFDISVEKFI